MKKTAAMASMGTTNLATSGVRYSVPKKTIWGDVCEPTSFTKPVQCRYAAYIAIAAVTVAVRARSGNRPSQSSFRSAAMQPHDMPRNEASRTTLVKYCRKTTSAANQRMQASSRKRTRKPTANSVIPLRRTSAGEVPTASPMPIS